ncbi:MAG: tRNA lysidine(34) synthetase TilS [Lacisediminihabitans sp.]
MTTRPRLTPAIADVRRAVRTAIAALSVPPATFRNSSATFRNDGDSAEVSLPYPPSAAVTAISPSFRKATGDGSLVLVALSGGADSLALAAATAFEAQRAGIRAGAIIVDHGLQEESADVAAKAADQARSLGLGPVVVKRVEVAGGGGPEAAARDARYAALTEAAEETGATRVFLGHTLDDQAETVLLGLARGSGGGSLKGMPFSTGIFVRPLLNIRRTTTRQFCVDSGLEPWNDPQNEEERFRRVRVRSTVLPMLERELGPGIAEALVRTAAQLREDTEALDHFAEEQIEELAEHAEAGLSLGVKALAANPAALRQRIIRLAVQAEFGVSLSRGHTLEVARLVTDWHGQEALDLPGITVEREGHRLVFTATTSLHREP